ncbi:MAG: hypothetical protein Q7O66_06980, partial [Dehalococcoidia bacterium]|nr:hypothetical protein [Dehalococcoidia bacterium]
IKADKHDSAKNLISSARHYLMSLPQGECPVLLKDNETELEIQGKGTIKALARGGGRSERCRYLLKTERAFWEDTEEELAAISGALVADGYEVNESTANAFDGYHAMWVDQHNGYRHTFVGRHDNPRHTAEWWQEKVRELAATPSLLDREYPETPEAAFVASGLCLFDKVAILAGQAHSREPLLTRDNGHVHIWALPVAGHRHVAGADVAEGRDAGNDSLDYSHLAIYDFQSCEHVLSFHCQLPPDLFAERINALCREYNDALLGVERNNHGHTVLLRLRQLQYPKLYMHVAFTGLRPGERPRPEAGWPTTTLTKPIMEAELGGLIARQELRSYDSFFWDECLSYKQLGNGKTGSERGCHDDRVIAHGIAIMMRRRPSVQRDAGSVPMHSWTNQAGKLNVRARIKAQQRAIVEAEKLRLQGVKV